MFTIGDDPIFPNVSENAETNSSAESKDDKLTNTFTTESKEDLLNKTFDVNETSSPRRPLRKVRCNSQHVVVEYQVDYSPSKWNRFKSYCRKKTSGTFRPRSPTSVVRPTIRRIHRGNKTTDRMVMLSLVAVVLILCFVWMFSGKSKHSVKTVGAKIVDLSYSLSNETLFWPKRSGFVLETIIKGKTKDGNFYQTNKFCMGEHGGTHLDAPSYFLKGQWKVHEIPITRFVAPAVVINISKKASVNSNSCVMEHDIVTWERIYGPIPNGALIFMFSGWGKFWTNKTAYYGGDVDNLGDHLYPGFCQEVAKWVVKNRKVVGFGADTAAIEFETSKILATQNIYGLVNVANLEKLPPIGARVWVMPMLVSGVSGSPARILAELP